MPDPRLPLAGRFAFAGLLRTSQGPRRWLATENDSGRRVIAVATEAGRLATLESAKGVKHRHLAGIVDVVRDVDPQSLPDGVVIPTAGGVAVAEYMPGTTLKSQLDAAAVNATKAVAWTLRLAESVQALHQAGGVHGAISLRSVVAEPEARKIAPVLSQLLAQPVGAFCPPERLRGSVETSADDVWALHAVLFAMLTREAPFKGGARDALLKAMLAGRPKPLASFGIDEPVLEEILMRGLVGEKRLRVTDLPDLVKALDGWERDRTVMPPKRAMPRPASRGLADIASGAALGASRDDGVVIDDELLPDDEGTELRTVAPPLGALSVPAAARAAAGPSAAAALVTSVTAAPAASLQASPTTSLGAPSAPATSAAAAKPPSKRVSINPFEKKRQIWPLLVIAALGGGAGVYLAVAPDTPPPAPPSAEPAKPPPPPVAAPAKAVPKRSVAEERDACVVAYFPDGAFKGTPNFEFVCTDKDFRDIASGLNEMVSSPVPAPGSGGGAATADAGAPADVLKADAGVKGSGLDWYELPATAIIRRHCCVAAAPLTLPESAGWCEQLQSAVRRIADDSSKAVDLAPAARDFDKAVNCLFANKIARPYAYEKPPSDANRAAFQQFLGRAAVSDARR